MADIFRLRFPITQVLFVLLSVTVIFARKHHLTLDKDFRSRITLSSFGFLKHGTLTVNVTYFGYDTSGGPIDNTTYGFTLDISSNSGSSGYMEDNMDKCILKDVIKPSNNNTQVETNTKKETFSIVIFRMDFQKNKLFIERRGKAVEKLIILPCQSIDAFWKDFSRTHEKNVQVSRPPEKMTVVSPSKNDTIMKTGSADIQDSCKVGDGDASFPIINELEIKTTEQSAFLNFYFLIAITDSAQEGMYTFNFHNCKGNGDKYDTSFTIHIVEINDGNYLSASKMPLPYMYFILSGVYLAIAVVWNAYLCKSKDNVFKMHYLMLVVVFVKSLSCLFSAINYHFIQKEGVHEEAWAVVFYIAYLSRGALLFVTIILIGSGWAFIKHVLTDREKKLFLIVIPLQILDNIAFIILAESEEGQSQYTTWKEIFIFIDLLCCGAILFPVVWSIRHLQEASMANGKAEFSLTKLKLFRQFYIMVVCYIYLTRIIVRLLTMTVPFNFEWLGELFMELTTIMLFVFTGYKFRPVPNNPYLQVPTDEEDLEMDEVVIGEAAVLDTVKRVNQGGKEENTGPKMRESSYEYD